MKKTLALALLFAAVAAQAQTPAPAANMAPAPKPVYDEAADARAELNLALAKAQAQNKNVLVIFGANWCKDCLALNGKMSAGPLAAMVDKRYVLLKVDVQRFTKNVDLAAQMGVPLKKGIPAAAVLKRDGDVLNATSGGELADARSMGDDAVIRVLEGLHAKL